MKFVFSDDELGFGDTAAGKESLSGLTLYANATFNFLLKKDDKIFFLLQ